MRIQQKLVSSKNYRIKCPYAMKAEWLTIHETANDAAALNEITYMVNNSNQVSYHYAVDDKEIWQGIPTNRCAWHAGDGASGTGNRKSLSIEICYSKSGGVRYERAKANAAWLAAKVLIDNKIPLSKMVRHYDWSRKSCPHRMIKEGKWEAFKAMVKKEYDKMLGIEEVKPSTPKPSPFKVGSYNKYVKTTADLNIRSKRNASGTKLGVLKKGSVIKVGYIMYTDNKTTGTSLWGGITCNGKIGFIHLGYAVPTSAPKPSKPAFKEFKVKVTADTLNVREKATVNSKVVTQVKKGEVYTIVGQSGDWYLLKSKVGYIHKNYVTKL